MTDNLILQAAMNKFSNCLLSEFAEDFLDGTEPVVNGIAHSIHLVDYAAIAIEIDPLVMHSIYLII